METFRTRYTLPTVHWSRSVQDAEASQLLIQADDGSLTVKCIEVRVHSSNFVPLALPCVHRRVEYTRLIQGMRGDSALSLPHT